MSKSTQEEISNKFAEAELYKTHGLIKEASDVYHSLLEQLGKNDAAIISEINNLLSELDEPSQGLTHFSKQKEKASKTDPAEETQHRFETGVGLMDAGFPAEALEEMLNLLGNKHFSESTLHIKIGECYLSLNDEFKAIEHFEKARDSKVLDRGIERLEVLDRLALAYENIGAFPAAIKALEEIVKINPKFRNAKKHLKHLSQSAQKFGRFYHLIQEKHLKVEDLEKAIQVAKEKGKPVDAVLMSDFNIDKHELGQSLSDYYDCPFLEFNELEMLPTPSCIKGIKEKFFRANNCVPVSEDNGKLVIAADNPFDMVKTDNIRSVFKSADVRFAVALKDDIDKFIDFFYGKYSVEQSSDDLFDQLELVEEQEDDKLDEYDTAIHAEGVVVQLVNKIIEDAIKSKASDIHIETLSGNNGTVVRFRTDGDCKQYRIIPYQYKRAVVSRIKILARLDISERRLPQDGKIKFKTRTRRTIELRVATLPTASGYEDVVLRVLTDTKAMPLEKMGFSEHNFALAKKMLEMPYGLILVVGPTGSGKTTTLHAALGQVNRPEKKIWTVEDPVEIIQDGLRQIQVQPGIDLTFEKVLKAFLRADPDIIMVGETRDEETAKTVIEASLTGHLVLTTLHTNSAPETITRLLGMGIESYSFADSLIGVIAQRLIKRLCPNCKEAYKPEKEEKNMIIEEFGAHPISPLTLLSFNKITLYKPKGCKKCHNSGYSGRLAIHEVLTVDDAVKQLVERRTTVSEIRSQALQSGMFTLKQDGIQKVILGETDFKQVRAACIK